MSNVLVTGGAGFIGSHLCERLLESGSKVINLDSFNDFYSPLIKRDNISVALSSSNYMLFEGDIRDRCVLDSIFKKYDIDIVIHLAALTGVRKSLENPLEYIDVDIKGMVNLLECSKTYKIKKFVFASSSSVYGLNPLPFKEGDCVNLQVSPYAAAKQAGELFCGTYSRLYSIPMVCLRFFTVYGPRQRPEMAVHNFAALIDKGAEVPIYGDGSSSRDYTYIDDIINGITASINLNCSFEVFNLGNSNPIRLDYLVGLLEQGLGKQARRQYLPMQPGDVEHTYADITKSKNILGYVPKISIEEGIEKFIDWYKQKNNMPRGQVR